MVSLFAFQMVQNFQDESCFILSTLKGKAPPHHTHPFLLFS